MYVEQPYPYGYPPNAYPGGGGYGAQPYAYAQQPNPYAGGQPPYPPPYGTWNYPPPQRRAAIAAPAIGYGLVASAVLIAAAAFMPWAQVFGVSVDGTDGTGDGNWTLFLGVIIGGTGVVVALLRGRLWAPVTALVAAALVVLSSFKDITDVNGFANANGIDPSAVSVGPGLWLTLLAGLAAAAFAVGGISRRTVRS